MSQWNRTTLPTEADSDEWGNILVLRENGQKAVYHWEDYNEHYATEETAWMTLPESDFPKSVSLTIEVGDRSYTIESNGFTLEVHDSRDPMGQPMCLQVEDTIEGILEVVDGILQEELHPERMRSAEVVNDTVLQGFIDALRGNVDMDRAVSIAESMTGVPPHVPKKPWQKKK